MDAKPKPAACWWLYLIECRDGSLYTGVAVDVARRFRAHASGKGARYPRSHPPRRLLAAIACADRGDALRAEFAMKRLTPAGKRAFAAAHPPAEPLEV
jgi:putative endonuclease